MAKVKKFIGKGLSNMEALEGILVDIAKDLKAVKDAFDAHIHVITAAIKATGTVKVATNAQANDTATVAGVVYKFVVAPAAANDVKIGADVNASALNLKKAINLEAKTDEYGTGTVIHPTVSATVATDTVTVSAKTAGVAGNALGLAVSNARLEVSAANLASGADGVVVAAVTTAEKFDVLTVEDN